MNLRAVVALRELGDGPCVLPDAKGRERAAEVIGGGWGSAGGFAPRVDAREGLFGVPVAACAKGYHVDQGVVVAGVFPIQGAPAARGAKDVPRVQIVVASGETHWPPRQTLMCGHGASIQVAALPCRVEVAVHDLAEVIAPHATRYFTVQASDLRSRFGGGSGRFGEGGRIDPLGDDVPLKFVERHHRWRRWNSQEHCLGRARPRHRHQAHHIVAPVHPKPPVAVGVAARQPLQGIERLGAPSRHQGSNDLPRRFLIAAVHGRRVHLCARSRDVG